MAPGSPPISEGVTWRVVELGEMPEQSRLIWSGGAAEPKIRLAPGRYRIETEYGLAKHHTPLTVVQGKARNIAVVLNSGTIRVHAVAVAGGQPLDNVLFVLHDTEAVNTPGLDQSAMPTAAFRVPAGIYRVVARHGMAQTTIIANVRPGQEVNAEVVMNTGVLSLSAHATSSGPPLSGATYSVFEDSDSPTRREIVRSVLDEPHLDLPAGTYRVVASLGLAQMERKVIISAGATTLEHFVLNAGGVRLSSVLGGDLQPVNDALQYKVFAVASDGPAGQAVTTTASVSPTIFLREGKYRIESQYGWQNARQVREVAVSAGRTVNVNFVHTACHVNLKLVPKAGPGAMTRVRWTVKYTGGGTVMISHDDTPALILQPGSYKATAQHDNKTYSRTFEASPNAEQTVELTAE